MQPFANPPIQRTSLVRFSIRDLLWLMFWASIGSALVAAVLPRLAEPYRLRLLGALGLALLFVGLAAGTSLYFRARLERQAGPPVLLVPFKRGPVRLVGLAWLILGALLPLLGTVIAIVSDGFHLVLRGWVFYWVAYLSIEKAIAASWGRGNSLEFCQNGLIYEGKQLIRSAEIVGCHWGMSLPNRLFIQVRAGERLEIDVDPQQREAVSRALEEQVAAYRAKNPSDYRQHSVRDAS